MHLSIEGIKAPIALDGCAPLARDISAVLPGWAVSEGGGGEPCMTITRTPQGYARLSDWSDGSNVLGHKVDAVCDFLVDLMRQYICDNEGLLMLHCAAVKVNGGLVVFPSTYAAGKSTLAVHLAAAGATVYSDDVMPIRESDNYGLAPSILPRLRLPLPAGTRPLVTKKNKGPASKNFQYVNLGEGLAPLGESAPVIGMVLLQRENTGPAQMEELSKAEILKNTLLRRITGEMSALEVLDRLNGIVDGARCFGLTYASTQDAVDKLKEEFPW